MHRFFLRRLLEGAVVMIGISIVVFVIMRMAPGDPASLMLPDTAPQEAVEEMRRHLGLEQPVYVQLGRFVVRAVMGDFGNSYYYNQPVARVVLEALPATAWLTLAAIAITIIMAIPLGVVAATRRRTFWEPSALMLGVLGQAVPVFWLGLLLILFFSVKLRWLPSGGGGSIRHMVLPAITLAGYSAALVVRLTRSQMLEELSQDYIRTARAKGLSDRIVHYRHALRNTLIPLTTVIGLQVGTLMGGAVTVETVFNYPGVGYLIYTAISTRDYPLLQFAVLLISVIFVLINIVVDAMYSWVDPRVHYQ
jgi:peptide/nickel transport system permease protein